jgi:hypothetical protein
MRTGLKGRARIAGRAGSAAFALALAGGLLSGCGAANNPLNTQTVPDEPLPSIGDRFNQLFGRKSQAVGEVAAAPDGTELDCPNVKIRAGASTYAVAPPGKEPVATELRYQATISRTARDCRRSSGQIIARIGVQGRVIAGPAGAPATVEIPLRVAVVQAGVNEKVISTKVYRTTVSMSEDTSVPFSIVGEDLTYSMLPGLTSDNYIFYIGFDPQAVTPEPKPSRRK